MCKRWIILLSVMVLLTACATVPSGPMVMVLPGAGKPFDLFQLEDAACRYHAQTQIGVTPGQEPTQSTVSGAAIGTIVGAGLGAALGAAAGSPEVGAAVGAGTGLLMGTATGAESGAASARTLQWRYDVSYVQCMYAKGNQVPGTTATPPPNYVPPPPPKVPPPAGPAPSPSAPAPPPR
jgi:YMGG-like Gly-zipper